MPVIVGGAASYTAALHLMRTGAAGVLVGFGGGAAHTTRLTLGIHAPMASAIADVAAARRDYMDESGGRYVHVIADGGMGRSGDIVKAVACGADAVMLGAAAGPGHRGTRTRLPLGLRGAPQPAAPRRAGRGRRARLAGGDPARPGSRRGRHDQPHRRPEAGDGHDRLLRRQGVPAGRGRRRARTSAAEQPSRRTGAAEQPLPAQLGGGPARDLPAASPPPDAPPGARAAGLFSVRHGRHRWVVKEGGAAYAPLHGPRDDRRPRDRPHRDVRRGPGTGPPAHRAGGLRGAAGHAADAHPDDRGAAGRAAAVHPRRRPGRLRRRPRRPAVLGPAAGRAP